MMWIAVHLAFAALPFVLTAALYSRKRRFPAGEGDARARDAKARKFYAQLLLVLLLLYHYAYTNGHPSGFGVLLSTGACAALFSSRRTDRWLRGLSGRPRAFAELALAAVAIGFVPGLYPVAVTAAYCLLAALFYPSARVAVFSTQIISQFTEGDTQMVLAGQKSLFANGITFILFGFYTVYSSLFLALGKGAAGFFLGACRQGVCFVPVILLLPMVWGMNGILYAQPIADVISVVITVFMALHLHRELSMAEKQVMSNSEM